MKSKWLRGDNSVCIAVHFLSLPSIYKPSFISISLVLSRYDPDRHPLWKING